MDKTASARQGEALPAMIPDFDSLRIQRALRQACLASRASLAGRDIPPPRQRMTEPPLPQTGE